MKTYTTIWVLLGFLLILVLTVLSFYLEVKRFIVYALFLLLFVAAYIILKRKFGIPVPLPIYLLLLFGFFGDVAGNIVNIYGKKLGPLQYDSWMHLLTPLYISIFFFWVFSFLKSQKRLKTGKALFWFFIFASTFSLAAFYEVIELWEERYLNGKVIWGVYDTAEDLQWGMVGIILGMLGCGTVAKIKKKLKARNNSKIL